MKFNINKEMVRKGLKVGGTIGKAIIIEGIKGVLLKSATKAITTSFEEGFEGVKKLTVEDYVGNKKKKTVKILGITKSDGTEVEESDVAAALEFKDELEKAMSEKQ